MFRTQRPTSSARAGTTLALVLVALALGGCDWSTDSRPAHSEQSYIETGDLPQIRAHGRLRLLVPRQLFGEELVRRGHPASTALDLAQDFARRLHLDSTVVYVERREDLIPDLLAGKGDVVIGHLTVTPPRAKEVAFTAPVTLVHEQVVTRADDRELDGPAGLVGRRVAVRRSSSYWETLTALSRQYSGITIEVVPEEVDTETILQRVALGVHDVTVADSDIVTEVLSYQEKLRVAFDLVRNRLIAWAVRPDAHRLRAALDSFLIEGRVAELQTEPYHDDLAGIKKRRVLRMLTQNHPASYFIWRGQLMGFEYDLVREFAEEQGLRVKVIVPPTWDDLIPWLQQGRGDLIAASMTVTEERRKKGLAFSHPYHQVREVVVARKGDAPASLAKLAGRTFTVSPGTSYWETLSRLRAQGTEFVLEPASPGLTTDELIDKVAKREYDLTVADSHLFDIALTWRDDVQAAFALTELLPHAWAVTPDKPRLLEAINEYVQKMHRGTFYNLTYKKYFQDPHAIRHHVQFRATRSGQLSPYDEHARRYADRYGFDWRLIVAQMYQESRFDPNARSWAGALGLLQVLPRTARELGFTDLRDPATGIHAGVKYLAWLRDRFIVGPAEVENVWFGLAAYNAGYGHVADARQLAAEIGLDRDRWFGHVERAMFLLSKPEYYRRVRFGYVQGRQPVQYVREIQTRYDAYVRATGL